MDHSFYKFYSAHRRPFLYLFFGALTTAVNYFVFWLMIRLFPNHVLLDNTLTFAAANAFAYITNKVFVFKSRCWQLGFAAREAMTFTAARLFSFGVEQAGLYLAAYVFELGQYRIGMLNGVMAAKIILSLLAVLLNYLFSRLLVFRRTEEGDTQ